MAKRGPKGSNNIIKMNKGTYQPCRKKETVREPVGDNSDLVCPDWLSDDAKKIWEEKLGLYDLAGQNISGYGHTFALYCALEAKIIQCYRDGETPSMAMVNAHRIWAAEFYDTPASSHVKKQPKPNGAKKGFAAL